MADTDQPAPASPPQLRPPKPSNGRRPVVLVVGRIGSDDAAELCARLREALEGNHAEVVICDVAALERADAGTIDALARLTLTARRLGSRVRLRAASPELRELLSLAGLADVVPCVEGSVVEPER